jgi:hypothetical protein
MIELTAGEGKPRRYPARAGITVLNLLTPGLGLLRLGHWRSGTILVFAPFLLVALITLGMGHFPVSGYGSAVFALVFVSALLAALYAVSAGLTWRASKIRAPVGKWSRWYSLTAILIAFWIIYPLALPIARSFYKPFFAPSESMPRPLIKVTSSSQICGGKVRSGAAK